MKYELRIAKYKRLLHFIIRTSTFVILLVAVQALAQRPVVQQPTLRFKSDCSDVTSARQCCWDTDDLRLFCGDGSVAQSVTGNVAEIEFPNGGTITQPTSSTFLFKRPTAGTVVFRSEDDDANATLSIGPGGTGNMVLGTATSTSMNLTTDGGTITVDGTLTFPNAESISNATDGTFTFGRNDAGTVFLTAVDNDANAALRLQPGGVAALLLGSTTTTQINLETNGTGDGEVVLPAQSISGAEIVTNAVISLQNGAAPAATCTVGEIFIDTDQTNNTNCTTTADNSLCLCVAANTWVALENN